jgi:hypothetical protein
MALGCLRDDATRTNDNLNCRHHRILSACGGFLFSRKSVARGALHPFFQNAPFPPKSNKTAPVAKPLSACPIKFFEWTLHCQVLIANIAMDITSQNIWSAVRIGQSFIIPAGYCRPSNLLASAFGFGSRTRNFQSRVVPNTISSGSFAQSNRDNYLTPLRLPQSARGGGGGGSCIEREHGGIIDPPPLMLTMLPPIQAGSSDGADMATLCCPPSALHPARQLMTTASSTPPPSLR